MLFDIKLNKCNKATQPKFQKEIPKPSSVPILQTFRLHLLFLTKMYINNTIANLIRAISHIGIPINIGLPSVNLHAKPI